MIVGAGGPRDGCHGSLGAAMVRGLCGADVAIHYRSEERTSDFAPTFENVGRKARIVKPIWSIVYSSDA